MEKIYWDGFFARFAIQAILYQGKIIKKLFTFSQGLRLGIISI